MNCAFRAILEISSWLARMYLKKYKISNIIKLESVSETNEVQEGFICI